MSSVLTVILVIGALSLVGLRLPRLRGGWLMRALLGLAALYFLERVMPEQTRATLGPALVLGLLGLAAWTMLGRPGRARPRVYCQRCDVLHREDRCPGCGERR